MNNKQWLIAIVIGVGVLALLSLYDSANAQPAPRGVLITFTDGADLLRQYREVAGTCDTVVVVDTGEVVGAHPDEMHFDFDYVGIDTVSKNVYVIWYETSDTTIRYRKNVRITIIPEYWLERSVTLEYSPAEKHQAIITWEWIK